MREKIIESLNQPAILEKLYRTNKQDFKHSFNSIYPELMDQPIARVWYERLNFEAEATSWGTKLDWVLVISLSFIAGCVAKIPDFAHIDHEYFFQRNISFIVLPFLAAFFAIKHKLGVPKLIIVTIIFLISLIYINILPDKPNADTLLLACIHLPLFLWTILGYIFSGGELTENNSRLDFLRFNGDLVVMTAILVITGALLTGLTVGLFSLIDIRIEEFYIKYIAIWGAASIPIVASFLVRTNPQLVNKVSPVIAMVFTPLVLVMLVVYLVAVIYSGKDPYNDREFLLMFNLLLIAVMALIFFSITEISKNSVGKIFLSLLLGLSLVTIIINGIALSAIVFRISSMGITVNRIAVFGSNILMLIHLVKLLYNLLKFRKISFNSYTVTNCMATFIPIYAIWFVIVTFIFPILLGFK